MVGATENTNPESNQSLGLSWRVRSALGFILFVAIGTIYFTNQWLTAQYTQTTLQRAELRLALYSGNLISELQRNSIVPQLLARDAGIIGDLNSRDFTLTSQRLLSFVDEIGVEAIYVVDVDGRVVAATNREQIGVVQRNSPSFVNALRSTDTVFTVDENNRVFDFAYSRQVVSNKTVVGVIVVEVNLRKNQRSWASISDAVFVADSTGTIILATDNDWLGVTEEAALSLRSATSAIERAIQATRDWAALPDDAYVIGRGVLRREMRVPFQGWRLVSFTPYGGVRQSVNTILALEIMGFSVLLALAFYVLTRQTLSRLFMTQQESESLRDLNVRLQREITERKKVEKNLEVAEQTLAQSSKLAALGEMSAAVSHELNQPLAAMKTYLAGAKLLLQRRRPDEALSSFQRIDDLIGRMGAITRQLKSFARKGGEDFVQLDMRMAVNAAVEIMEPQLRERAIGITKALPSDPVMIMGDQLRLEQVIVNLLRNALDATTSEERPEIEILLSAGETATLSVRDNGDGIENLDELFEPFFTTKQPGDGIGLGLAISSGIVNDLGGRMVARNAESGGAVFEVQLPIHKDPSEY